MSLDEVEDASLWCVTPQKKWPVRVCEHICERQYEYERTDE